MAGGKLPPRQKMIGMMYLVLTALLALNVSKDILDAFIIVNDGIETSTKTFTSKNEILYSAFDQAAVDSKAAVPFRDKAYKARDGAKELYDHIEELKRHIIKMTDGLDETAPDSAYLIENVQSKDNYDVPTNVMGLAESANPASGEWSAVELKGMINDYRAGLLDLFEKPEDKTAMEGALAVLETNDFGMVNGVNETWETGNFYHVPLAAVITLLSKMQSDVRSAEAEVVAKLYENIDAGSVSFNKVDGFAFAKRGFVLEGDSFKAEIFTAAYDDRQDPEVYIGAFDSAAVAKGETDIKKIMIGTQVQEHTFDEGKWYQLEDVEGGKGHLAIKPGIGVREWGGIIKFNTKKGPKIYPFHNTFEVGRPSTTIAATKMNVFYIGVENPVSISAPVPPDKIKASGLGIRKSGQGWVVKPTKPGKGTISVSADIDGKTTNLGKMEFRIKRIPNPVPYVGGKTGASVISKAQMMASRTVRANMENFDFDLTVNVTSFIFATTGSGGVYIEEKVKGNAIPQKIKDIIKRTKKGTKVYFEKIMVKMPGGETRELPPVSLKLT